MCSRTFAPFHSRHLKTLWLVKLFNQQWLFNWGSICYAGPWWKKSQLFEGLECLDHKSCHSSSVFATFGLGFHWLCSRKHWEGLCYVAFTPTPQKVWQLNEVVLDQRHWQPSAESDNLRDNPCSLLLPVLCRGQDLHQHRRDLSTQLQSFKNVKE